MTRAFCARMACVTALVASSGASAQEGFEFFELISPEEEAEREQERERQAAPRLAVEPTSIEAEVAPGESAELSITVRNSGGQALAWTADVDVAWLEVTPRIGRLGPGEDSPVSLRASPDGLELGGHTAKVIIDAGGIEGSPAVIPVRLVVRTKPVETVVPPDASEEGDVSARGQSSRFSVRLSYEMPSAGPQAGASEGLVLGLAYGVFPREAIEVEVGAEVSSKIDVGGSESLPLSARVDALIHLGSVHFLIGGAAGIEFVEDKVSGEEYVNGAVGVEVGCGYRTSNDRFDVRATLRVLFADNIPGRAALSVGYRF